MITGDRVRHTGLTDFTGIVLFGVNNPGVDKGTPFKLGHGVPLDHIVCFNEDTGETRTFHKSILEVISDED